MIDTNQQFPTQLPLASEATNLSFLIPPSFINASNEGLLQDSAY